MRNLNQNKIAIFLKKSLLHFHFEYGFDKLLKFMGSNLKNDRLSVR